MASPTKFAEYLSCGLSVIISERLGDFTTLVEQERLGMVLYAGERIGPLGRSMAERRRLRAFALSTFTKEAYATEYRSLLAAMSA